MSESTSTAPSKLPVTVTKPTPYTFDLGLLMAEDPNPLHLTTRENLESDLAATARDGAQVLINQLLSTCPIASTPTGVLLTLPEIETKLPREKPLPTPKAETTWAKFAAKKGIKPKSAAARQKMVYDDATGEWVPKWGYKGANKAGESDWIVEVDEKKERERIMQGKGDSGVDVGGGRRAERLERMRRNERKMRANDRRARKFGA
ncbi:ribosomal biogenesis regulatory protein [Xylogone sp. PMI_703]|nr:ribosomal biogenesis regulatory protein [Xylogone sp. PMI_703]